MEEIKVQNQMDEMFEEPSGEDMLLAQIDAFRDKAKQLQTLISAKERIWKNVFSSKWQITRKRQLCRHRQ